MYQDATLTGDEDNSQYAMAVTSVGRIEEFDGAKAKSSLATFSHPMAWRKLKMLHDFRRWRIEMCAQQLDEFFVGFVARLSRSHQAT